VCRWIGCDLIFDEQEDMVILSSTSANLPIVFYLKGSPH